MRPAHAKPNVVARVVSSLGLNLKASRIHHTVHTQSTVRAPQPSPSQSSQVKSSQVVGTLGLPHALARSLAGLLQTNMGPSSAYKLASFLQHAAAALYQRPQTLLPSSQVRAADPPAPGISLQLSPFLCPSSPLALPRCLHFIRFAPLS
jgi:hypothetical protein